MKIGISAISSTMDAEIDPRFGRCLYFIVVDPDTMGFEIMENSGALAGGGAGIATAQAIAAKNVNVVLTGDCGPNAYQVLAAANIKVITGVSGKIQDAVKDYVSGKYLPVSQPNVGTHSGMHRGRGGNRGGGRRWT